jgi:hypothetical protein
MFDDYHLPEDDNHHSHRRETSNLTYPHVSSPYFHGILSHLQQDVKYHLGPV